MTTDDGIGRRSVRAAVALARRHGFEEPGGALRASILTHGGSDRHFIRLSGGTRPVVALARPGGDDELDRYIAIGRFLRRHGIDVPEQLAVDRENGVVLMEDLGSTHLQDGLKDCTSEEEGSLYEICLDVLVSLQTSVTDAMFAEGMLEDRSFDADVLLGETAYFEREFVRSYAGLTCPPEWDGERRFLAERLAGEPPAFMHRDFQSRNIMITGGRIAIIDFQTAHRGPGVYDVASLLKDPYHPVPEALRRRLLQKFHGDLVAAGGAVETSYERYKEILILAGIQRNCQALAAYAYLGRTKGKTQFLDFITPGLALLEEGIAEADGFPALGAMVREIRERHSKGTR
jgi:aminoglycoside/choline kinase family phosphotransferase